MSGKARTLRNLSFFAITGVLCAAAFHLFNVLVERTVARSAEHYSLAWANHAVDSMPRIEEIASGGQLLPWEKDNIQQMAHFGNVFQFKLFDRKGNLGFVSDGSTSSGADLGVHNPKAATVLESLQPYTDVADGTLKPDRPEIYTETYFPVVKDGRVIAIVELYLDQTATAAAIRADYASFGIGLLVLTSLGLAVPTCALILVLRRLRRNNRLLDAERRRAEMSDRAKSSFLANVTHELRTPMNGVMGVAQLLQHQDLDAEGRELLDMLTASAREQITMINDLLYVTGIDAGTRRLASAPFDPAAVVTEVIDQLEPQANGKGLAIAFEASGASGAVLVGDENALRQICLSLVGNAIKFTNEGRIDVTLDIHAREGEALVTFTVEDTGIGIAEGEHGRIFERFFQLENALNKSRTGAGLGLSICKDIVGLMGGTIRASDRSGGGSVFRVEIALPLAAGVAVSMAA